MKIYRINGIEGFQELQLIDFDNDSDYTDLLSSDKSLLNEWKELKFEVITKGKKSDFPYVWVGGGLITISEKAKSILERLLCNEVIEFLPITCNEDIYYLVHVINISSINFNYKLYGEEDDDKIVFNKGQILNSDIKDRLFFRGYLGEDILDEITFFTEKLIEIVKQTDLKGFDYKEVWSSEDN